MTLQLQLIIAAVLVAFGLSTGSVIGYKYHKSITDAEELAYIQKLQNDYSKLEFDFNTISGKLILSEEEIIKVNKEKLYHVSEVTSNTKCLSTDAVRLLNSSNSQGEQDTTNSSKPKAEGSITFTTDTDIYYWIAEAQALYETCAARQNESVDIFLALENIDGQ